jgi:hypothetical protein
MALALFARVGWMKWYRGPQSDDKKPIGGGEYNRQSVGHEAFNFLPIDDRILGYFQPKISREHESSIALERIKAGFEGDSLNDVLVILIATHPKRGGQRIIGWYDNATVHRYSQVSEDKRRLSFSYYIEAKAEDATLVPEKRREFVVPGGKGAFGQANVFYLLEKDGQPKQSANWSKEALSYVGSYELENAAQEPDSDMDSSIAETIDITIDHEAGFQSNPRIRKAIEMYAMDRAEKHLRKLGYKPPDIHTTKPYDYLCNVRGADLYVEVKGTQEVLAVPYR